MSDLTGLVWQNLRDQYTPDQSPYVLQVEVSLLKQLRGNVNRTRGIDTDDQGNVSGASERWAEFDASAATGDRAAVYAEIDRRYHAAAGTDQKIKPGEEGKAALWRSIRDEVLFQRAYLGNLPPQVAALIKVGIKGRPLTPADYDRLFRIAKRIEGMPPGQASDYASKITASTDDLATFEAALDAYATEMTARGKQDEDRQAVQLELAGLEGLYQTYRSWKEAVAADARAAAAAQGAAQAGVGPVMMPSLSAGIADQLDAQLKANGFASVGEFVGFIDKFTASFEQGAAVVAKDYLDRYSGYLYRQQERYRDPGEATALYQALAPFRGDYDDFQNNVALANKWVGRKQNDVPGNWQQTYAPDGSPTTLARQRTRGHRRPRRRRRRTWARSAGNIRSSTRTGCPRTSTSTRSSWRPRRRISSAWSCRRSSRGAPATSRRRAASSQASRPSSTR